VCVEEWRAECGSRRHTPRTRGVADVDGQERCPGVNRTDSGAGGRKVGLAGTDKGVYVRQTVRVWRESEAQP
jgi:hypothetical protein